MGLERLAALLAEATAPPAHHLPHAYLVAVGDVANRRVPGLAEQWRDQVPGLRLLVNYGGGSFKAQLKRANRSGAQVALIVGDDELARALQNPAIVRHRQKVPGARTNARIFIDMQKAYGSFSTWLWEHVDGTPLRGNWASMSDVPAVTPLAEAISKDLKKRGMTFVGPTIIYAYLQAVGVVNDHYQGCWKS